MHYAAAKGAPFEVMELLLGANPMAVTAADKVRRRVPRHRRPRSWCRVSPPSHTPSFVGRCPPCRGSPGRRVAQDGMLPLHYSAQNGPTLKVVKLLLGPESNAAATATAAHTARRSASTTATHHFGHSCPLCAPSLAVLAAGRLG